MREIDSRSITLPFSLLSLTFFPSPHSRPSLSLLIIPSSSFSVPSLSFVLPSPSVSAF